MSTTVTYKGQTLTTVENQTKTLQTAGTWVEGDFTLTDASLDVSDTTATAPDVAQGKVFYTADGVMTTGTGSAGESIGSSIVQLAKGTKEAGITSADLDDGLIDTGLTLNDLRAYKYICIKIRLDDAKPYLGFRLGNTNIQVVTSNAMALQFTWMDSAKTVMFPVSGASNNNSLGSGPHNIPNISNNVFAKTGENINHVGAVPFEDLPSSKVYVGITHMNGLSETTKNLIWAVYGLGDYQ